ncbi:uncharacterized protein LOC128742877 [Sabethes cyaneus]|uniref:uncharacterized protein LOC128742877 n=1 Tax=Sabethes cyaneus TaxID=53552 RepID=UPI00237E6930|nr:uncharacterized protein LOC128742877 [Sabethes cyaneus]
MLKFVLPVHRCAIALLPKGPAFRSSTQQYQPRTVQRLRFLSTDNGNNNQNRGDDLPMSVVSLSSKSSIIDSTAIWKKDELLSRINELISCKWEDLLHIYKANRRTLRALPPKMITDNIQLLLSRGIPDRFIVEYPKILSVRTDELTVKLDLLSQFKGLKDINHLVPLLKIKQNVLKQVVQISLDEDVEHGNRLYLLQAKTGLDIDIISRYLSSNIRVYKLSLSKFLTNLDYCLEHMEPMDVIRHLSILAHATASIAERLQMLKSFPLQKVKPWMIRTPKAALEKTFDEVLSKGIEPLFENSLSETFFENHVKTKVIALLNCSNREAKKIFDVCKGTVSLLDNIEALLENGVHKKAILKDLAMLTAKHEELISKLNSLARLKTVRDLNDVIPLCVLKPLQVLKIVHKMNSELFPNNGNRIYHFADHTGIPAADVARQFARRTFMFNIPKDGFIENLEQFTANMNSEDVLADLWAFKYSPAIVAERIARAKAVRGKKLMPWMVRCPDIILEKSLELTKQNRALLGDHGTILEYLQKRLGLDEEVANSIIIKVPSVQNVRMTKIKSVIDYLLNELNYSPYDIALNPRILMHSLETTKRRMEQLRQLGCRPRSLVIVCKSQRQYNQFMDDWIATKAKQQPSFGAS